MISCLPGFSSPGFSAPGFSALGAEAAPATTPAPEVPPKALTIPGWEGLAAELDALASELDALRDEAQARLVDAPTRARLERVGAWLTATREKERRIRELYALWRVARADPRDER